MSAPLQNITDKLLREFLGWDSRDFRFNPGQTPFSATSVPVIGALTYLLGIFLLQKIIRTPFSRSIMKKIQVAHNFNLVIISLVLFLLVGENVIPKIREHGIMWGICDRDTFADNSLIFYYYLNYLSKYLELLDTVILVMMKKELQFLHVYHHTLTMVLCYVEIVGQAAVQWVPIFLNLFIHIVMYSYYLLASLGYNNIPGKSFITLGQITQFILDCAACYTGTYIFFFASEQNPILGYTYCHGTGFSAVGGSFLLSTYLVLFIQLFKKSSKPKKE